MNTWFFFFASEDEKQQWVNTPLAKLKQLGRHLKIPSDYIKYHVLNWTTLLSWGLHVGFLYFLHIVTVLGCWVDVPAQ